VIYADCAAQYPPLEAAVDAAENAMKLFGNPSSVHSFARENAKLIFEARKVVASAVGAKPSEIVFTASGSEADTTAVFSAAREGLKHKRNKLLIFSCEHSAVVNSAKAAQEIFGCELVFVPCLENGSVDLSALSQLADEKTALVSVMHANNETGIIQPIAQAAKIAHSYGALFHTDAVQTVGHIPVNASDIGCDMLSISAHKFGGIAGAGALCCRKNIKLYPLILGGGQENGRRAGTQNTAAICAMGAALDKMCADMDENMLYVSRLRDMLEGLCGEIEGVRVVGGDRVPGILCVYVSGQDGERLSLLFDREGICVSSGAACSTGTDETGRVLTAMGFDRDAAKGALRFSLCERNTEQEIRQTADIFRKILSAKG